MVAEAFDGAGRLDTVDCKFGGCFVTLEAVLSLWGVFCRFLWKVLLAGYQAMAQLLCSKNFCCRQLRGIQVERYMNEKTTA